MALEFEHLLDSTGDMALKRRARTILNNLEVKKNISIVDIGCGDGYYLHLLNNLKIPGVKLVGTDFDSKGLEKAEKNLPKNIKLTTGDLMKRLPFSSESFDRAVMSEVAEHLPDDVKGLREVRRILKKQGVLCLTVPHARYPFLWDPINWILEKFFATHIQSGFFAGIWNQHIRLYTPESIARAVEEAGFKIEKIESLTYWSLPFNHYLVNLVARYLHVQYTKGIKNESLNKFTLSGSRTTFLKIAFKFVNTLDKLNDIFPINGHGVAVFIKAVK